MKIYKMNPHPGSFIQTAISLLLVIYAIMQQLREVNALVGSVDYRGNEIDYMALLAIKSQLIDHPNNSGVLSSWNNSLHHCSWEGVICGHKHKRVVELDLVARGLGGTISPFIGNLSFLKLIMLGNNSLSGQIPREIGRLNRLKGLHLYNNSLTGEIPPNISGCVDLQKLSLAINNLQGQLPVGLGALTNLRYLSLSSNEFSGNFFKVVANLTSLKKIRGDFNAFTGTIPDSIISRMQNLSFLDLTSNKLSGKIPPSMFNLSSLQDIYLASNQLLGSIPLNIASTLPKLHSLVLFENYLSGPFPISLQNLTSVQSIVLDYNNFTGSVPVNFGNLPNLQWLYLHNNNNFVGDINFIINTLVNCSKLQFLYLIQNHFTGILPKAVANLSKNIVELGVGGSQISGGIIPIGISNLINLRTIDIGESRLRGPIPQELGKLQRLENLYLDSNRLTGEIPSSFGNLSYLSICNLSNNHLHGKIPPSLGSCKSLLFFNLENNKFKGSLPKELFGESAKFVSLNLSQNKLEGSLPDEICEQINLVEFDVSGNRLSGEITPLFDRIFGLQKLYMKDNFFHGSIPTSFASLKSLTEIDLSQNNISGPIPDYFSSFPLISLNLSYNNFEGNVPTIGVYANASAISLVGNSRLCGGISELHLPRCPEKERKKRRMSCALKSTIMITCAFAGVLAMVTFIWLYQQCHRRKRNHVSSHSIVKEPFLKVSYNMLLKATNGFSFENLLGSGTFGSVYKGILDGHTIAVKVLNLQHQGGSKSFMAECTALRNVRHRNLVRIITACSSIDFQGNDFKALVYEFMSNGSLDRWLHEEGNLNLLQRLDIAIDVAHALIHLHHECDNTIVHCDLKPSNMLLDDDLVAHVADFGLAKVLAQSPHPNQSCSIGVRGTIGYAAPEYGLGGEASVEADLYSYGILLLELMTRKRPTENLFQEDFNLHMYAKMALPNQVMQIVDSKLIDEDDHEDEVDTMRPRTPERLQLREMCIKIVIEIGVACSEQLPHNRIKLSAAVIAIQRARNLICNPKCRRNLARGARG